MSGYDLMSWSFKVQSSLFESYNSIFSMIRSVRKKRVEKDLWWRRGKISCACDRNNPFYSNIGNVWEQRGRVYS